MREVTLAEERWTRREGLYSPDNASGQQQLHSLATAGPGGTQKPLGVAALGLSLVAFSSQDSSLVVACGLLLAVASLVWNTGSRAHGLSGYNFELLPRFNHLLILRWLTAPLVLSQ